MTWRGAISLSLLLIAAIPAARADTALRQRYCESVLLSFAICKINQELIDLHGDAAAAGQPLEGDPPGQEQCVAAMNSHHALVADLVETSDDTVLRAAQPETDQQWSDAIEALTRKTGETEKQQRRRTYLLREDLITSCNVLKARMN